MSVLLVDWLGRGGIAQTAEAWAVELRAAGRDVEVVTRADRELGSGMVAVRGVAATGGRLRAHAAVVRAAAAEIRRRRPRVVVIQNYVIPALEAPVHRAAAAVGARTVVVVHDHRLHSRVAGTRAGLRRHLRAADLVVAHTNFVAAAVRDYTGRRDVTVIPHPVPVGMLHHPRSVPPVLDVPDAARLAIHFGVLKRRYKGTAVVTQMATAGVPGWIFAVLGVGASARGPVLAAPGFLAPGALCGAVARSHATLLPYTIASQSGAVVLAQVLGSVPVASAVGGIPEQIVDGDTGVLVPPGATADRWRSALADLDESPRAAMAARAQARVWADHAVFASRVTEICSA